jgi:hypothetical protein
VSIYLGIDPGASGGLAASNGGLWSITPMPATERDIWNWIVDCHALRAVIEKVGGYIAGNPSPGSAMFKFGLSYGGLRMALIAASIPFDEVTPQRWQKTLGISPRGKTESKSQFKNRLKGKAQQLFPQVNVTLATADAVLLAEYCRREYERKPR